MTSELVDEQGIEKLLSTISSQRVEVHVILHMGKLAISGKISISAKLLQMDITDVDKEVISSIEQNSPVYAITFLNGEKLAWDAPKISISGKKVEGKNTRLLKMAMPILINKSSGRKDQRQMISPNSLKIKLQGHPETFDLVDLSPGGCSFTAPSSISKTWDAHAIIEFEATSQQMRLKNKLKIVRISFDMQNNQNHETVISCKFENEDFGRLLLEAVTC